MVKVIMGVKGSGKTKQMVDTINAAVAEETGSVVCIEKGSKLVYDIKYSVRLIEASDYPIGGYSYLKGFISGLHAGNYDITHFFIDNFYKLVEDKSDAEVVSFVKWLDAYSNREQIDFTISMTADRDNCPEELRKFLD